uniref:Uncharacterized protein n=1 Tax=Oryza punctata TaxID=4537 RepID=A0A0E0M7D5_ORYPU
MRSRPPPPLASSPSRRIGHRASRHLTRAALEEGASAPAATSPEPADSSPAPAGLLHRRAALEGERRGRAPVTHPQPILDSVGRRRCSVGRQRERRARDARERDVDNYLSGRVGRIYHNSSWQLMCLRPLDFATLNPISGMKKPSNWRT